MDIAKRPVQKYNFQPFEAAIKKREPGARNPATRWETKCISSPVILPILRTRDNIQASRYSLSWFPGIIFPWSSFSLEILRTGNPRLADSLIRCSMVWMKRKSGSSPPPYRLCWMKRPMERVMKNEAPGTTEYVLKDAMNG